MFRRARGIALAIVLCATPLAIATERHSDNSWSDAGVVRAGDLDRDRVPDFLWVGEEALAPTTTVTAVSGKSGGTLWTVDVPGGGATVVPRRVGPNGVAGMVVAAPADGGIWLTHAYDSAGERLWTSTLGEPLGGAMGYVAPIDATPGGGDDLLFVRGNQYLTVVDGTDGTTRMLARLFGDPYGIHVVGDIDRDRRDDVAVVSRDDWGEPPTLTVYSGAGTGELWSSTTPEYVYDYDARVVALGDLNGDGFTDLGTDHGTTAVSDPERAPRRVEVRSGRTGDLLWAAPGTTIVPLASRGNGVRVAVGTSLRNPYRVGLDVRGYDARGRTKWSLRRLVRADDSQGGTWSHVSDVDGDGVADLGYSFVVPRAKVSETGVVDGRTGRVRRDPEAGLFSAGAFDGRGADRISWKEINYSDTRITAWRGDGAQRLWEVTFDGVIGRDGEWFAMSLDGDRCEDLVVEGYDGLTALDGSNGQILWTWTTGETFPEPDVRSHRQYARTC